MEEKPIEVETWDGHVQYHFTAEDDPSLPPIPKKEEKKKKKKKKLKVKKQKPPPPFPWVQVATLALAFGVYMLWPAPLVYIPLSKIDGNVKNCKLAKSMSFQIAQSLEHHILKDRQRYILCACTQQCVIRNRHNQIYHAKNLKLVRQTETCARLEWQDADDIKFTADICGSVAVALKNELINESK